MLPLRGEAVVLGDDRPTISQLFDCGLSSIHHRFDGEDHSGFQADAATGSAVMQNLGFLMELLADAMSAEFTHDAVTQSFGEALYGMADISQHGSGPDRVYASPHRFMGAFTQAPSLDRRFADVEHAAGVPVITVFDGGDIEIDDISILQFFVTGNAVTDLMVDRGADGFRIWRMAVGGIVQRGGDTALDIDHVIMA